MMKSIYHFKKPEINENDDNDLLKSINNYAFRNRSERLF